MMTYVFVAVVGSAVIGSAFVLLNQWISGQFQYSEDELVEWESFDVVE